MNRFWAVLAVLGPGFAVAATGVGAGDIVAAAVSGADFGLVVLWAAAFGAVVKFVLNEGIARWQLATGTTLLEGWAAHLSPTVLYIFMLYFLLWSYIVGGALMAACGLAAYAMFPALGVKAWGILHSLVAIVLVHFGQYKFFENSMKLFIGLMFVTVLACAVALQPDLSSVLGGALIPTVPKGGSHMLLGMMGGVGGSVTVMCYSYWLRERGWDSPDMIRNARLDLGAAYLLTGLFGMAVIVIAAQVSPDKVKGAHMGLAVANQVGAALGPIGKNLFLAGFWGAVFSSMLGVWQGVPYLFADFVTGVIRKNPGQAVDTRSRPYVTYLLLLGTIPASILFLGKPVWVVIAYSVAAALFMPFLGITLLVLNNRGRLVGDMRNSWVINALLFGALGMFLYLAGKKIFSLLG